MPPSPSTVRPTSIVQQQQQCQITTETVGGYEIDPMDRESTQQLLAILRSLAGGGSSSSVQPIVAPVFPLPLEQQNTPSNGRFWFHHFLVFQYIILNIFLIKHFIYQINSNVHLNLIKYKILRKSLESKCWIYIDAIFWRSNSSQFNWW